MRTGLAAAGMSAQSRSGLDAETGAFARVCHEPPDDPPDDAQLKSACRASAPAVGGLPRVPLVAVAPVVARLRAAHHLPLRDVDPRARARHALDVPQLAAVGVGVDDARRVAEPDARADRREPLRVAPSRRAAPHRPRSGESMPITRTIPLEVRTVSPSTHAEHRRAGPRDLRRRRRRGRCHRRPGTTLRHRCRHRCRDPHPCSPHPHDVPPRSFPPSTGARAPRARRAQDPSTRAPSRNRTEDTSLTRRVLCQLR